MLRKPFLTKRNYLKIIKTTHSTPTIILFLLVETWQEWTNHSLAYPGIKLKRNNLVNACYTRDAIVTIKISDRSKAIKVYHMNELVGPFSWFRFWWWTFPRCIFWCISSVYVLIWISLLLICYFISLIARETRVMSSLLNYVLNFQHSYILCI